MIHRKSWKFGRAVATAIALQTAGAAFAGTVTFDTSGIDGNAYPFADPPFVVPMVYQQVYDAQDFGDSALALTGIAFRVATLPVNDHPFSATIDNIRISIGLSAHAWNALSGDLASNIAAPLTVVRDGSLHLSSSAPGTFDIVIPFDTTFNYDPSMGNLLIQVENFSGGGLPAFGAGNQDFSRALTFSGYTYVDTGYGLATQFLTRDAAPPAVPEPASWALMLAGFGAVGAGIRRARRVAIRFG